MRPFGRAFLWLAAIWMTFSAATPLLGQTNSDSPELALRDAIMAACRQNTTNFDKALTARNVEAFDRMTPAARATFLKRFVLLDKPGQPRSDSAPSGNDVSIYCENPDVTVEIRIGKAQLRDNLAFLPFEIKDSSDTTGSNSHRVAIGMVRESGQWKLLSLGLLLLDLPSLEEEWDRAESQANEKLAIAYVKELADAIEKYRQTYTRLPDALAALGPAKGAAKPESAGLVSAELSGGRKDGYTFRYVIVGANSSGAPAKYELAAIPTEYGRTGTRSFFRDSNGVLHAADRQGAVGSAVDPKLE